ncbi:MAG: polysaccharide deacetylase family protein [Chitinophagaceae bacterium]|nr:polysaccharide deacetylase family protein [Chitinophagaceae bacterium]
MKSIIRCLLFWIVFVPLLSRAQTYAEKLGYPKGSKVLILHVDDAGMSKESNEGVVASIEKGVANSFSIMMPCPWVPEIFAYLKKYPKSDAGLHLTMNAEWNDYRWPPLAGAAAVPGLTDSQGAMWSGVVDVVTHAKAQEIALEIQAQLQRSRKAGWEPTHFDSHMGTLFATPAFLEQYLAIGMREKIPVMFPGGHNTLVSKTNAGIISVQQAQKIGEKLWQAGLPVIDDLHNLSYGFRYPQDKTNDQQLQKIAANNYINSFKELQPGITMVIMHCSVAGEHFEHISSSGIIRRADWLAMQSPDLKAHLEKNNIILTTWRELMERRKKLLIASGG